MAADDITKWENHRIFVVGEKTGKLVETDLGLRTEGGSSGNAKALAEYILKRKYLHYLFQGFSINHIF